MRFIIKKRTTCTKGKRVVLKGYFMVLQKNCAMQLRQRKRDTKTSSKKGQRRLKSLYIKLRASKKLKEEAQKESDSGNSDCIIVDVK